MDWETENSNSVLISRVEFVAVSISMKVGAVSSHTIGVNLRKMDVLFTTRMVISGGNTFWIVCKMRREDMLFSPVGTAYL